MYKIVTNASRQMTSKLFRAGKYFVLVPAVYYHHPKSLRCFACRESTDCFRVATRGRVETGSLLRKHGVVHYCEDIADNCSWEQGNCWGKDSSGVLSYADLSELSHVLVGLSCKPDFW